MSSETLEVILADYKDYPMLMKTKLEEFESQAKERGDIDALRVLSSVYGIIADSTLALNKAVCARSKDLDRYLAGNPVQRAADNAPKKEETAPTNNTEPKEINSTAYYSLEKAATILTEHSGVTYSAGEVSRMTNTGHIPIQDKKVPGQSLLDHLAFMENRHFVDSEPEGFYESIAEVVNKRRTKTKALSIKEIELQVSRGATSVIGHVKNYPSQQRISVIEPRDNIIDMITQGLWLSADELISYGVKLEKPEILAKIRDNHDFFNTRNLRPMIGYIREGNVNAFGITIEDIGYAPPPPPPVVVRETYGFELNKVYARKETARRFIAAGLEMFVKNERIDALFDHLQIDKADRRAPGDKLVDFIDKYKEAIDINDEKSISELEKELKVTPEMMKDLLKNPTFQQYIRKGPVCDFVLKKEIGEMQATIRELGLYGKVFRGTLADTHSSMEASRAYQDHLQLLNILPNQDMIDRFTRVGIFDHSSEEAMKRSYTRYEEEMNGCKFASIGKRLIETGISWDEFFSDIGPELAGKGILKNLTKACEKEGDAFYVQVKGKERALDIYFLQHTHSGKR